MSDVPANNYVERLEETKAVLIPKALALQRKILQLQLEVVHVEGYTAQDIDEIDKWVAEYQFIQQQCQHTETLAEFIINSGEHTPIERDSARDTIALLHDMQDTCRATAQRYWRVMEQYDALRHKHQPFISMPELYGACGIYLESYGTAIDAKDYGTTSNIRDHLTTILKRAEDNAADERLAPADHKQAKLQMDIVQGMRTILTAIDKFYGVEPADWVIQ